MADINLIKRELSNAWGGYKTALSDTLICNNQLLEQINNYLLNNSGKELRPLLSLLAASACGVVNEKNYYCAASAEIVHTATLLHDDVADKASTRRGSPTVKSIFGEAASVLTGDFWLSKAMWALINKCNTQTLEIYSIALTQLSEGELIQMNKADELTTTKEDYYQIIHYKTSSLFIAAMKGAVLCLDNLNDDEREVSLKSIESYAYYLGLAFQIRDDIFDYSPHINSGKDVGSDIRERKITLPLLCAMEIAPKEESNSIREAIKEIEPIGSNEQISSKNSAIIVKVNDFVLKYKGMQLAQNELDECISKAISSIDTLNNSIYKDRLREIAEYVGIRKE